MNSVVGAAYTGQCLLGIAWMAQHILGSLSSEQRGWRSIYWAVSPENSVEAAAYWAVSPGNSVEGAAYTGRSLEGTAWRALHTGQSLQGKLSTPPPTSLYHATQYRSHQVTKSTKNIHRQNKNTGDKQGIRRERDQKGKKTLSLSRVLRSRKKYP